tara:strand:- start:667 stop:1224 length:558 start_codon:yes stop_codon:yes gene_type:complete
VAPPMSAANRILVPVVALVAVLYLVAMVVTGALPERRSLIEFQANGVLSMDPIGITRVTLTSEDGAQVFERSDGGWTMPESGAKLDERTALTLDRAVKFMHTASPVREFPLAELSDGGLANYGLQQPVLSIVLETPSGVALEVDFGDAARDGILQYMHVKGADVVQMISRFVSQEWQAVAESAPQ